MADERTLAEREDHPNVHEALVRVMKDVLVVRKEGMVRPDKNGNGPTYKFRGIDAVMNAVGPVLRKHGVIVAPVQVATSYGVTQTKGGAPARECTVMVTYRFVGPEGDTFDVMAPGESLDYGDKGTAKAMSVAFRIALLQALCLPTDDPDPDEDNYQRANHAPQSGRQQAPTAEASTADRELAERAEAQAEALEIASRIEWGPAELATDFLRLYGKTHKEATTKEFIRYQGVLAERAADFEADKQRAAMEQIEKGTST